MSPESKPVVESAGTLAAALARAQKMLATDPALAAQQASEILQSAPGHPVAQLVLGIAHRCRGVLPAALAVLGPLAQAQPGWFAPHYELGLAFGAARRGDEAIASLRRAVELKPDLGDAWRALADHLRGLGDHDGADAAYARHLKFASRDPRLFEAGAALVENRLGQAETLLLAHLKQQPSDIVATRMLAEVATRTGLLGDAEVLLARCLELAPSFTAARYHYAAILNRIGKSDQALAEIGRALAAEPDNPAYRNLKAAILGRVGEYVPAIEIYAGVLAEYPGHPNAWISYGHALRSAGRREDSIAAYRRALTLRPGLGEAWWSLANLKTFRFNPADLAAMQAELARADLAPQDRYHLHFATGKALEDLGSWAESFSHYEQGNRLRLSLVERHPDYRISHVARYKTFFSKTFFAGRGGFGTDASDPIFIVGLPRAGSTLIEQILSSHSAVEGTKELPDVISIARLLGERKNKSPEPAYPELLAALGAAEFRALGESYMERTRIQRKTIAPYFIDKMPNNFAHVGLIHLMLPRAKIIDVRRHPLGGCFSAYKQHFAQGQLFTYDLAELGRYYRDYVELMAHYDEVLPGRVHRVFYERMVTDTEAEIRRLLDYCGLPFEAGCLRFHENERAVRTASSEQVRRPIYQEAVDHWRNFEPWLGPLKEALGPVLDAYPAVPEF